MNTEGVALGKVCQVGEEAQTPGLVRGAELFQEQPPEQPREHPDRQKEPWPA